MRVGNLEEHLFNLRQKYCEINNGVLQNINEILQIFIEKERKHIKIDKILQNIIEWKLK